MNLTDLQEMPDPQTDLACTVALANINNQFDCLQAQVSTWEPAPWVPEASRPTEADISTPKRRTWRLRYV